MARILVFDCHGQSLASSDQYSEFFGPGKARVNQVSEEHLKMLGECRAIENTSENRVLTSSFLCIVEIKIY